MSQEEIYNTRDRTYSAWHRRRSTGRFIGIEKAQLLAMIDLDASLYVEYDNGTKDPLALIETAEDVGQLYKTATVTYKLAKKADIPCFVVLYEKSECKNPADKNFYDISQFRVRRLYPKWEKEWRILLPEEWSKILLSLRDWSAKKVDKYLYPQNPPPQELKWK